VTRPWEKYSLNLYDWDRAERSRDEGHQRMARMGDGKESIEGLKEADSEGAVEMIEAITGGTNHYHLAVNLPNDGYITNIPEGAIVETPGLISGFGARGFPVGALPEPVAQLLRAELARVRFSVDAAALGDRQAALQCLLLDPNITDIETAKAVLDDYLTSYRQYLPQFWH
jgi:alpha-galactosidase